MNLLNIIGAPSVMSLTVNNQTLILSSSFVLIFFLKKWYFLQNALVTSNITFTDQIITEIGKNRLG